MDNPAEGAQAVAVHCTAEITVSDVEGDPGWYRVDLKSVRISSIWVHPHVMLVGKLDKK